MATDNKLEKVTPNDQLANVLGQPGGAMMERPSFIPEGDTTGTEGITSDDIRLPRLAIAQGLSPQVTPGDSAYMEDLKLFQMFNDFSKVIYGNGPLFFIPVRRDVRRIEFKPRSEGGGVIDMNVSPNDPRTLWTNDGEGKRVPPKATKFNEFVVLLLDTKTGQVSEPIVLSIKDTNKWNRRAATDLNGFIKMHASKGKKSVPIYGVIYTIESKPEKNDSGTFGVPVIKQYNFVMDQEMFKNAAAFAKSLEGKNIQVEREPGEEDPGFDPNEIEGQTVPAAPQM